TVQAKMDDNELRRADTQPPPKTRTFGSVFVNPRGQREHGLRTAGQLIDACGLRGEQRGRARISPDHCNWIENTGGASADEVVWLMHLARRSVFDEFSVLLEPEVVFLGDISLPEFVENTATR